MSDEFEVDPQQLVPPAAHLLWPNIIPSHAVSIISGITRDGQERLYVLHSTRSPHWVIAGMLGVAYADVVSLETEDDEEAQSED
jgi:hypothetical protein